MALTIILDTGALSNSVVPLAKLGTTPTVSQQCRQWMRDCERAGSTLIVPAIAYYETLREMERRRADRKIERLKSLAFSVPGRFVPVTTSHLETAARLWGHTRRGGLPTASNDALDVDVILAAQALGIGIPAPDFIIATTNVGHLSRFVPADLWTNITP